MGLSRGAAVVTGRQLVLSVDFEAFSAERISMWLDAMDAWASASRDHGFVFSFFIALEDVVRLRAEAPSEYPDFLKAVRVLGDAGSIFYPHSHCAFDPRTGLAVSDHPLTSPVPEYGPRPSMFYDIVYRNHLDWAEWVTRLTDLYREFLADAALPVPERLAFRPGGWDHGSSESDLRDYIGGLAQLRYAFDSSASAGAYGTRSWRVGAPFGKNVYALGSDLHEVAACWSFDCGVPTYSRTFAGSVVELIRERKLWSLRNHNGAFVTVLHFDHLFHAHGPSGRRAFAVSDVAVVRRRMPGFIVASPSFAGWAVSTWRRSPICTCSQKNVSCRRAD